MKKPQPRKLTKAEQTARALRQRVAHDRSKSQAIQRENHLRRLMGLAPRTFSDGTSIRDEP